MRASLLYKIASVTLVLFALGHTIGFLTFKPPTAEGVAVHEAMKNVHFQVKGATFSYAGFYVGFGLSATVSMLFWAFLSWHLSGIAETQPEMIGSLGWAFFAVQAVGVVLSLVYFAAVPAVLSVLVALCVGWAAWLVGKART